MKVLVTGGCGFIGSHITDMLVEKGHNVMVVDNLCTGNIDNLNKKAKFYNADICSSEIASIFEVERPDVVFHEAAQIDIQLSIKNTVFDARTNIIGTVNVLKMVADFKVKKLIYASSAAVYGNPLYLPVDEKHPVAPISFYGISKHTPEHYIDVYSMISGFEYTILRYANVFGPRQDPKGEGGVVSIFTDKLLSCVAPIIFGDGEQTRDFVYVKDVALANVLAIDKGNGQIINVSTNSKTSVNTLYSMMKKISKSKIDAIYAPARVGDIDHSYLDNTKAGEYLGFAPVYSLEEGLSETINYYKR